MTDDSQEYKESNLWIVEGTPQFLWDTIWETNKIMFDVHKPLNRNVANKYFLAEVTQNNND